MHSIFISDLHLCPTRPAINRIFFGLLRGPATQAQALYILGDLFEYWAGDDDDDAFNASVLKALRELVDRGVALYVMHGNRDFLIGERFSAACRAQLLERSEAPPKPATRTCSESGKSAASRRTSRSARFSSMRSRMDTVIRHAAGGVITRRSLSAANARQARMSSRES